MIMVQGSACVVNAASNRDIEVFAAGMIQVKTCPLQNIETPFYINVILFLLFCLHYELNL